MRFIRIINPAGILLFLGAGALICTQQVYAQHEQEEKQAKPEKQQPSKAAPEQRTQPKAPPAQHAQSQPEHMQPRQNAAPQTHQPQEQRVQQQKPTPQGKPAAQQNASHQTASHQTSYAPPQRSRQQAQTWQQQSSWRQNGAWQQHSTWQQNSSSNWQADHRTWAQRGGYGGFYIPEDSFGLYFGSGHSFRLQSVPVIVGGYPQFQYGGYSFMMVDPYPGTWAPNWYASDDVYVGFDNGYYLYNRAYPGPGIAISVVL